MGSYSDYLEERKTFYGEITDDYGNLAYYLNVTILILKLYFYCPALKSENHDQYLVVGRRQDIINYYKCAVKSKLLKEWEKSLLIIIMILSCE